MRKVRVKSVQIDRCPGCQGTWYDTDELRLIKDREQGGDYRWIDVDLWKERRRFVTGEQEGLACPKDRHGMTTLRYGDSKVRVEVCGQCHGIWLDHGEYERIVAHLEEKVNDETLAGYLADLRDEFVEIFTGPEGARSELADLAKVLHLLELRFVVELGGVAALLQRISRVPGA
jgi:Zn-finger nucleic acid-binding protein